MRTGIHDKNWNAHNLIPKLKDWGVSLVSVSNLVLRATCILNSFHLSSRR